MTHQNQRIGSAVVDLLFVSILLGWGFYIIVRNNGTW